MIKKLEPWKALLPWSSLEDIKDVENRTVADGARPSIDPHVSWTNPAIGVSAWNKRRAFLSLHAHAAHPIILSLLFLFFVPPTFTGLVLRPPVNTVRLFNQSHQCLHIWSPWIALSSQCHCQIHPCARGCSKPSSVCLVLRHGSLLLLLWIDEGHRRGVTTPGAPASAPTATAKALEWQPLL